MALLKHVPSIAEMLKKYRYPLLVFLAGIVLITLPGWNTAEKDNDTPVIIESETNKLSLEEQLQDILSSVDGAGKVRVMLTISSGEETIYQTDMNRSLNAGSESDKYDTVVITDSDRNETGLVRQVLTAKYRGAVIVCQGADNPTVCLAMVDAVAKLTGLGTDRITVLKMK